MKNLLHNIRFYVLTGSIFLSLAIYLWISSTFSLGLSKTALLVEYYGLLSIFYLFLTLLAGPFCYTFQSFPFNLLYIKSRRALGVSAFYFATLHSVISFFNQLGGFYGLGFLGNNYLYAVAFGFVALFIFSLLTITSLDYAVLKLSYPKWKVLHRFVYLAGILILIHTLLLGTHFSNLSSITSQITFIALAFLFFLEALRFDAYLTTSPKFGISTTIVVVFLGITYFTFINPVFAPSNGKVSFDIHSAHKLLSEQAQSQQFQQKIGNFDVSKIPGLSGDRTKRYTVSMSTEPQNPQPNQDVNIHFTFYDASSGNKVELFKILFAKPMHLIIVNSNLTYFTHIHPTEDNNGVFSISTKFPNANSYHLYIESWPFGGIEQQIAFTLPVGLTSSGQHFSNAQIDSNKAKTFGSYLVSINTYETLRASAMSIGEQKISFTIYDSKTKKPVKTLKPYLASFGHLTMINERTFDFIHVHPFNLIPPLANANGGPTVDFLPIGIYGPFKPGIYRAFAEFNPDNKLFTSDFTIKVN